MPDLIHKPETGELILPTNADPAGAGHQVIGYRRFILGLDVGGRGDDPSALSIVKAEAIPFLTGNGFEQALRPPSFTVVYTEAAKLPEATDVVDWVVKKLQQLPASTRFGFDATGLGAPLASLFEQAKVEAVPVTMTAGSSVTVKDGRMNISKNVLFEECATCFENGTLRIAGDLPERDELIREITSIEWKLTSAGNATLAAGGRGHHADRFCATAIAVAVEQHCASQTFTETKLINYW